MALRRAGFFRELRHGSDAGPSLRSCRRQASGPDEVLILRYLQEAPMLAAFPSMVDDYLEPANRAVARLTIVTDGSWCWPSDLPYYVREYHVELPADFVAHMRERSWRLPDLTDAELSRLGQEEQDNPTP